MTDNNEARRRSAVVAQQEAKLWDALIGADGSPAVQKFILQQRLYAFVRMVVGIERDNKTHEMRAIYNCTKNGAGEKLKQFIDFIEGEISVNEAQNIKKRLQKSVDFSETILSKAI